MTERVRWTQAQVDQAIAHIRQRHLAAMADGDLEAAEKHEGWMNRLLDARKHHPA